MIEYKSAIRSIPYSNPQVYAMLSDLSNLKKKEGFMAGRGVTILVCDADSCSIHVDAAGQLDFSVLEREPCSTIKLHAIKMGIPVVMTIALKPTADNETSLQLMASLGLDPFMASMVAAPFKDALNKLAEGLASLSYE
jgi:hypothetical protein